jgi:putative pyruvate formate lyase activating enzyme
MDFFEPSYIQEYRNGALEEKIEKCIKILNECTLCPRKCKVNRLKNEKGICRVGRWAVISSFNPHFGEESPLVGFYGSGTIFFSYCNLGCIFCQNYEISHLGGGHLVSPEILGDIMLKLKDFRCHNINFVTPTHVVPQILEALPFAIERGLNIPLVYNCGGYENIETLKLLEGIFDIYMPDFKYMDKRVAFELSKAEDYPEVVKEAIKEMYRQVGDLKMDNNGIAYRGLLIRHLILPNGLAGTEKVMEFIAKNISPYTYVNIMNQYRPCYKSHLFPKIGRRITEKEFDNAINIAINKGIRRIDGIN